MKLTRGIVVRFAVLPLFLILISGTQVVSRTQAQTQSQHPLLDAMANKVIQKYQTTPCQELIMKKEHPAPPTPQEQKAVQFLKVIPRCAGSSSTKSPPPLPTRCSTAA